MAVAKSKRGRTASSKLSTVSPATVKIARKFAGELRDDEPKSKDALAFAAWISAEGPPPTPREHRTAVAELQRAASAARDYAFELSALASLDFAAIKLTMADECRMGELLKRRTQRLATIDRALAKHSKRSFALMGVSIDWQRHRRKADRPASWSDLEPVTWTEDPEPLRPERAAPIAFDVLWSTACELQCAVWQLERTAPKTTAGKPASVGLKQVCALGAALGLTPIDLARAAVTHPDVVKYFLDTRSVLRACGFPTDEEWARGERGIGKRAEHSQRAAIGRVRERLQKHWPKGR